MRSPAAAPAPTALQASSARFEITPLMRSPTAAIMVPVSVAKSMIASGF